MNKNRPNLRYEFLGHTQTWAKNKGALLKDLEEGLIIQTGENTIPVKKQYLDENKVKSNLPILLHQADMLASRIEYENWKHQDDDVKPEPIKQVNKQEQKKVDGMKKRFDELFN